MGRLKADNANPVAGTYHCPDCNETASVFVIQKSRRKGMLYTRCGCGCDQRTGVHIQQKMRDRMEPRPGFEWVKAGLKAPPGAAAEPDKSQDWTPGEQVPTQVNEPEPVQVREPEPTGSDEPNQVQKLRQAVREKLA